MPTLNIAGRSVTVGDEFAKLPPDQQNAVVAEIAASLGIAPPEGAPPGATAQTAAAPAEQETVGWLLPLARNNTTGELHAAVPQIARNIFEAFKSGVTLPGDVVAGRVQMPSNIAIPGTVPYGTPEADQFTGRMLDTAGLMLSPTPAFRTGRDIARAAGLGKPAEAAPVAAPVAAPEAVSPAPAEAAAAPVTVPPEAASAEAAQAVAAAEAEANGPRMAGNINLDRINSPEDVKDAIRQAATANADFMPARRGVITHEETRDLAQLVGMTPEKLAERKIGQAFNPEEMFAARQLLVEQATKVRDLARVAEGGSDLDKATFAQAVTRLVAIQEQVSGATAEAGRTLSQFRMMADASKQEIAQIVQASKVAGIEQMAAKINALDSPAQVARFAADAFKAKTSDMLLEAWINALLSGPQTHAANVLSNSLVSAWSLPETAVAAAISKFTGSGIYGREVFSRLLGTLEGAIEGIRAGWRAFRTEMPSDAATKLDVRKFQAIPSANVAGMEIGGKQIRIPGRMLQAEDEFFKSIGYRQEINALATRQALSEGGTRQAVADRIAALRAQPTEAMQEAARLVAAKQTFTNPLGDTGNALITMARSSPWVRLIIPFIRTPINIVKYAAERSPFAPLFSEVRANLSGANGAVARDQQIARITLGSTVSAVAAYLAAQDTVTGGGPADAKKRALMYANGWQPYSIRIGNTYYSYSRMEPLGTLLGVAADAVQFSKAMKDPERNNIAALIMGSVSKNLVSKTFLKGVSDMLNAVNDPDRYGARYVQNLVGTLVPSGVAQYARANDPYMRDARSMLDAIKSRIPGERETLFLRRDSFGDPIKQEGALGPDWLSPIYMSTAKNDPAIAEMLRVGVTPAKLQRKIHGVELQPAEYDQYSYTAGRLIKAGMDSLVHWGKWRELPDAAKKELMEDVTRKSGDLARTFMMSKFPDLALRIAGAAQKKRDAILQPPEMRAQ